VNLGEMPGLIAGASLLVDYVLTVAVSVSAGVAAITSAFPELYPERVYLCLGFVTMMMLANLRGLKESGRLFAGPTYVVAADALIVVG
jgi:amino acid transporter